MSLEQAIAENTAAIRDLIAALAKGYGATPAQTAEVVEQVEKPAKKTKPTTSDTPTSDQADTTQQKESTTSPAADAAPAQDEIEYTYADVQKAVNALVAAKGGDVTIATLAEQGLKTAKEVENKPEAWAPLIEALQKAAE